MIGAILSKITEILSIWDEKYQTLSLGVICRTETSESRDRKRIMLKIIKIDFDFLRSWIFNSRFSLFDFRFYIYNFTSY